jgi:hypothetical protein
LVRLVLVALLLAMAVFVAARHTPVLACCPTGAATVLVSVTATPTSVAAGGIVTVDVHLTNPNGGVLSAAICYALPNGSTAPGCQGPQIGPESIALSLFSGTAADGVWRATINVPPAAAAGTWTVQFLNTTAVDGFKGFGPIEPLFAGGSFTVIGGTDTIPPNILAPTLSASTIPLGGSVTVRAEITDDSGVAAASIQTLPSTTSTIFVPLGLVSGTLQDGFWQVVLIPTALGTYYLATVAAEDAAGNFGEIGSAPTFLGSFTVTAAVVDQSITATGSTIATIEGQAFAGPVANFNDADLSSTAAEYTATIDWGDGSTSAGAVAGSGGGPFAVSGAHVYTEEGSHNATVTITDSDNPSNSATPGFTATVADAALAGQSVCPATIQFNFDGPTASFTDANPGAHLDDFTALINWGDGDSSAGVVTGTNPYTVSGAHVYTRGGPHTVTTAITDAGGSTLTLACNTRVSCDEEGDNEGQFECHDRDSHHNEHGRDGRPLAE